MVKIIRSLSEPLRALERHRALTGALTGIREAAESLPSTWQAQASPVDSTFLVANLNTPTAQILLPPVLQVHIWQRPRTVLATVGPWIRPATEHSQIRGHQTRSWPPVSTTPTIRSPRSVHSRSVHLHWQVLSSKADPDAGPDSIC